MASETVAKLYARLQLDLSGLDADFALADKTVSQAISRINHETNKVKIQTELDIAKLNVGANSVQALTRQEESLTKQLELQRQKIELVNAAYLDMVKTKGENSAASAKLETRLLNEQRKEAALLTQLKTTKSDKAVASRGFLARSMDNLNKGASITQVASQGVTSIADSLGLVAMASSPWGKAATATIAAGAGFFALAKSAATSGNAVYQLALKLHTTTGEASMLNRIFTMAGADVNDAVPAIMRLDKSIASAGQSGNETTRMLQAFGVTLTDQYGKLLPINKQIEMLAQGYRNARAAGLENEFTSQVLGPRGASLAPVLEQYDQLQGRAKEFKGTGLLDPTASREFLLNLQQFKGEVAQLKNAVGAAMVPVFNDLMPEATEGVKNFVEIIANNKDNIKDVVKLLGSVGGIVSTSFSATFGVLDEFGINIKNATALSKALIDVFEKGKPKVQAVWETIKPEALMDGISELWNYAMKDYLKPETPKTTDEKKTNEEKITQTAEETKKQYEELAKKQANSENELQQAIFKATHNTLENQLHDIDLKAEKYRQEGISEEEITRATEAEKAKIMQDFNDNTLSVINSVWKSEFQNRLDDIEKEKRAWIQKGVDEVTATRWAEHEKTKARQNEALSMFKENKEYLTIMRNAMAGNGSIEERTMRAKMGILMAMRKNMGIEDERTTPEEVAQFSNIMNSVKSNLVVGLESESWAQKLEQSTIPVIRGGKENHDIPGFSANITVNGGMFTDASGMNNLANQIADKIKPLYDDARRNVSLAY